MGADSKEYNRDERIKHFEEESLKIQKCIDKMHDDSNNSITKVANDILLDSISKIAQKRKEKIDMKIESLKKMNESEKHFTTNYDLKDYRNEDGTFNIYKCERPLNKKYGETKNTIVPVSHHEGVAIGNKEKKLYFDYGVNAKDNTNINMAFRCWDDKENKDIWTNIEKVGTSNASDNDLKTILYGENSEKWIDKNDYNTFLHNCQTFSKEKIKELENFKKSNSNKSQV